MTNLSEKKGGGLVYSPALMEFGGSTGYFSKAYTATGNKVTVVGRVKIPAFVTATSSQMYIARATPGSGTRFGLYTRPSDYATADERLKLVCFVASSAPANVCTLVSDVDIADGLEHVFFFSYDGDSGTAVLIVDGADADNVAATNRNLTTGALSTATPTLTVGAGVGGGQPLAGQIGFFGHADAYLTNWAEFMDQYGNPKPIDESTWAEWGAQPLFWNKHGDMVNNLGSAGAMTKNGTINVGDAGAGPFPMIGLPTIGTAESWHVKTGKTAWVDGAELVGDAYTPAMMDFDGSTGYFSSSYTSSGNKVAGVIRFARATFTGNRTEYLLRAQGPASYIRLGVFVASSDFATADYQSRLVVRTQNAAGTNICNLLSVSNFLDGLPHTLFYLFDGDAGTATFIVDGNDEDDTGNGQRVAPTTGTLNAGASSAMYVGASVSGALPYSGEAGFFGMRDIGGLTWSDFMQTDGSPKNIVAATAFGGTPLFWNPHGDMVNNLGSAGAMTKNGTINVGDGGST